MLLEWPALIPDHRIVDFPVTTSDIFPTLLEAAGIIYDEERPLDGISLIPLLKGEVTSRTEPIGFRQVASDRILSEVFKMQTEGTYPKDSARLDPTAGMYIINDA